MEELLSPNLKKILNYVNIPTIFVGLLLNASAYVVFTRRRFKKHKIAYYSRINITSHCINLCLCLVYYYFLLHNIELKLVSNFMCKFFHIISRSCMQISAWIEILITFDRNNSIRWMNRFLIRDKRAFVRLTFVCAMFILVLNSPNLGFKLIDVEASNQTITGNNYSVNHTHRYCVASSRIYVLSDILLKICGIYLPFVIITYMNVNLFKELQKSTTNQHIRSFNHQAIMTSRLRKSRIFKKELNYGLAIFAQNVMFLMCFMPLAVVIHVTTVEYFIGTGPGHVNTSRYYFVNLVIMLAVSVYYSTSFLINIIFNRIFCKEFTTMIEQLKRQGRVFRRRGQFEINRRMLESDGTVVYEYTPSRPIN